MSTALSAAMLSPKPLFPPLTRDLAVTSLIAGIAADLTWEFWARVITPFLPGVGGPLEPARRRWYSRCSVSTVASSPS